MLWRSPRLCTDEALGGAGVRLVAVGAHGVEGVGERGSAQREEVAQFLRAHQVGVRRGVRLVDHVLQALLRELALVHLQTMAMTKIFVRNNIDNTLGAATHATEYF